MRKYASAEERAAKNQKTTVRHFGFTEKVYGPPCTVRTMLLWKRHHTNAIVRISFFFTGRHSSGSSLKAGCLCSYHINYIHGSGTLLTPCDCGGPAVVHYTLFHTEQGSS